MVTPIRKEIAGSFDGGKIVSMRVAIPADGVGAITLKVFTYSTASGKMRCDWLLSKKLVMRRKVGTT